MKALTVCMTTSRDEPHVVDWFYDSLNRICQDSDDVRVIVVWNGSSESEQKLTDEDKIKSFKIAPPKPNVWQGDHRLTKEDWWAVCNARNTALALCETEWIAFVDDRCVLTDTWLQSVKEAMDGMYIVGGAYEKRTGMKVENGVITHGGIITGKDPREIQVKPDRATPCHGGWLFGCTMAMPLEWALRINGWPEIICDSLSFEDVISGIILQNNRYPIRYDPRMKIIEDRTPEHCGPVMKRTDKGVSPNDKSHAALKLVQSGMKRSENPFGDIRKLRKKIQLGESFPVLNLPQKDWFDGQLVSEF